MRVHQRLGQVRRFRGRKRVEVVLELPLLLLVASVDDGEVDGAPVCAVEDGGGTDVEEDHGVTGTQILMNGPLDSEGTLVAEIDGDADLALGAGGGGFGG